MFDEIMPGHNPSGWDGYEQILLTMVDHIDNNKVQLLATLLATFPEAVDWRVLSEVFDDSPLLHLAITRGSQEIVNVLLAAGANPELKNARGYTSLAWAALMTEWGIVDRLLQAGVNPASPTNRNYTALHFALRFKQPELAARLIRLGAPVNVISADNESPLSEAIDNHDASMVRLLLSHGSQLSSGCGVSGYLGMAVKEKDEGIVLQLLKAGIDPDGDFSAFGGRIVPLTNLIRKPPSDADPSSEKYEKHEDKILEITQLLLNCGADPNLPGFDDLTPFCAAVSTGRTNIISLLVEHGAVRRANPDTLRCRDKSCPGCRDETPRHTVTGRAEVATMVRSLDPVMPLQVQCRLLIRKSVVSCRKQGESLISNVQKLPLPPPVKSYLCNLNEVQGPPLVTMGK